MLGARPLARPAPLGRTWRWLLGVLWLVASVALGWSQLASDGRSRVVSGGVASIAGLLALWLSWRSRRRIAAWILAALEEPEDPEEEALVEPEEPALVQEGDQEPAEWARDGLVDGQVAVPHGVPQAPGQPAAQAVPPAGAPSAAELLAFQGFGAGAAGVSPWRHDSPGPQGTKPSLQLTSTPQHLYRKEEKIKGFYDASFIKVRLNKAMI